MGTLSDLVKVNQSVASLHLSCGQLLVLTLHMEWILPVAYLLQVLGQGLVLQLYLSCALSTRDRCLSIQIVGG